MLERLAKFEPYFKKDNGQVKVYGQFGIFHTRRFKDNLMVKIEGNAGGILSGSHNLCTFGALFYDCNYGRMVKGKLVKLPVTNNIVEGEAAFKPLIEQSKGTSMYLIPGTRIYNNFNFTLCYYGCK